MKKTLITEQAAARDARKERFRALWKQVAAMPETERIELSNKAGFVTCDGHALSLKNSCLLALQCPTGSVFGGFRQWIKHGRAVKKGEHGAMIWIPLGSAKTEGSDGESAEAMETRFGTATVFDISQTQEIETSRECNEAIVEHAGNIFVMEAA